MKTAYFAGGCFWCITPVFARLPGVASVVSGYCGGQEENPTYAQVKRQQTGHRETVAVVYDPERLAFAALVRVFLRNVDPFDGGGQFIDRGASYTLAIFYQDGAERSEAESQLRALEAQSGKPAQVALLPFAAFWPAEEEHQDYYVKHPEEFEAEMRASGRRTEGA